MTELIKNNTDKKCNDGTPPFSADLHPQKKTDYASGRTQADPLQSSHLKIKTQQANTPAGLHHHACLFFGSFRGPG